MMHFATAAATTAFCVWTLAAQTPTPKKPATPEEFLQRFDRNGDGFLVPSELPEALAKGFSAADRNSDGKLDRQEIAGLLGAMKSAGPGPAGKFSVDLLLKQFDTDGDGTISKAEAKGRIADTFAQIDRNSDGKLDRDELRAVVQRMEAAGGARPGGFGFGAPDFDALDKNADGRLTPDELRGSPLASRFAEIDADASGQIDRREFDRFQKAARKKE